MTDRPFFSANGRPLLYEFQTYLGGFTSLGSIDSSFFRGRKILYDFWLWARYVRFVRTKTITASSDDPLAGTAVHYFMLAFLYLATPSRPGDLQWFAIPAR